MKVLLSKDAEQVVRDELDSGRFDSAREVVREALYLLQEQSLLANERRARLNDKIEVGLAQLDRGEAVSGEQVFRDLREKSRLRRRAS